MKTTLKALATRTLVYALASCLALEPAFAQVTISQTPLATSGGSSILANLMFILDDSGSMDGRLLPVHAGGDRQCMSRSSGSTSCTQGEPPFDTGGLNGANGVAYDPNFHYKPAVKFDGSDLLGALDPASVPNDAFGVQSTQTTNLTTGLDPDEQKIVDQRYCNTSSGTPKMCKRNGATADGTGLVSGTDAQGNAMGAGQFPYQTHLNNGSQQIFGLPEMMAIGSFARAGSTVTGTTLYAHGLTTSDRVYVAGTGDNGLNVSCVAVTAATSTAPFTFSYATASGSGTINAKSGNFRKCVDGTFVRNTSPTFVGSPVEQVRVTSTAHGLVDGDRISTFNPTGTTMVIADRAVDVTDADTFIYLSDGNSAANQTAQWVRTGLYNVRESVSPTAPPAYSITPIEHCSDDNLSNCILSATPTPGFTVPAYVRFCQTQEQALAPVAVGDASGTPRCRNKYVDAGTTRWRFGRYGIFNRSTIQSGGAPFARKASRADCSGAPNCTYEEEIQNYARWFTYYRTRMQMMKTAAGRAFQSFVSNPPTIADKLRVGFITINPYLANDGSSTNTVSNPSAKYLRIAPFDQPHAEDWYTKFYAQKPGPYTPLRAALSRVGWIFAGKMNTSPLTSNIPAADDPVEAACQRNFALLTSDGYWNGENGVDFAGSPIGNVDNVNPTTDTPYTSPSVDRLTTGTFDGGVGTVVSTATPTDITEQVVCQGTRQTTFGTVDSVEQTACACGVKQHAIYQRIVRQAQTIETTDGVETLNENVVHTPIFSQITIPCVEGNWEEKSQPKTAVQIRRCIDGGGSSNTPVTFWDGAQKPCTYCSSSKRRVLIRQTRPATQLITTTDGFQTATGSLTGATGTITYHYSKDGSTWSTTEPTNDDGCTSNDLSGNDQSSPTTTNNGSSTLVASAPGTTLTLPTPNPTPPTVGAPITSTTPGGYPDTLADVAMYYYRTDLRGGTDFRGNATGPANSPAANSGSGGDVSSNVVPAKAGAKNFATHQHMVTFGVGMIDGLMRYQADYETALTGDFANIKNGVANGCFWVTGTCNWPEPDSGATTALDDMWHASVSGRGQFFLSKDVDALQAGIQGTLNAVNAQVAAAAASATSSPNITQTNNQIFSTTYETITWSGKVFAQTIDPNTGNVNPTIQWHADTLLLGKVLPGSDTRSIHTFDPSGTNKLKPFTWASLSTDEKDFFLNKCGGASPWQQCGGLTGTPLDTANDGLALVGYLRGQSENEGLTPPIFRDRTFIDPATNSVTQTVLGDTISAKPAYVREATFNYGGTYTTYAGLKAARAPRVYVGANDGYMHAFDGDTGQEAWSYVPRFLMPGMYQLADTNYTSSNFHTYFVDGSPETADVCATTACAAADWRTLLVAGVNGGGRGFFALDISSMDNTTPGDDPKGLWEFCADPNLCAVNDPDLGFSFGNAVIGKRSYDGRWVVVVTSGLNNGSAATPAGSGEGFFYVLDAITGEVLSKVGTGVGTDSNPSGLMKLSAFFDNALTDATFRYIYGGDQFGNVFRLDMGAPPVPGPVLDPAPPPTVVTLAVLKDGGGRLQPITTRPALTHIGAKNVLYVGTGRYLGSPDLEDGGAGAPAWQHSLYAFIDKGATYTGDSLRDNANMKRRDLTAISPTERGIADPNAPGGTGDVDWTLTEGGWFIDFNPSFGSPPTEASPGEGVNIVDPRLVLGTLVVTTNAPSAGGTCAVGGTSFFYNFDFKEGTAVSTSPNGVVGYSLGGTITVGVAVVQLPSGAIKAISTGADTTKTTSGVSIGASGASVKRFSYRLR